MQADETTLEERADAHLYGASKLKKAANARGRKVLPVHMVPLTSRTFGYLRIPLTALKGHYVAARLCIAPFEMVGLAQTSFTSSVEYSTCCNLVNEEHSLQEVAFHAQNIYDYYYAPCPWNFSHPLWCIKPPLIL
jgi:hypothetical protein